MRRKDREMSREFGLEVINRAAYGVLSVVDSDGAPYALPLSIVRDGENLYFHSARAGHKVELFNHEPSATIVFVGRVEVPDVYTSEVLESLQEGDSRLFGSMLSRIFTTDFESAIVKGQVIRVADHEECVHALRLICEKYTPEKMDLFDKAVESGMPHTAIYRIKIDMITAKRKLVLPD